MQETSYWKKFCKWLFLISLLLIGLAARYFFLDIKSGDWVNFINHWTNNLREQGFSAFKKPFSDYAYLYLYLLLLILQLPVSRLYATKFLSIIFDFIQSLGAYKILKLNERNRKMPFVPVLGALIVFLCPTAIINSSGWAQCDSIYTALLIFSIYYLLKRNGFMATICFSIAFCLKLQSVFILPVFTIIFFSKKLREYYKVKIRFIFLPILSYILIGLPTWFAGRTLGEILSLHIYFRQLKIYTRLSLNAPTIYNFSPLSTLDRGNTLIILALVLIALVCLIFIAYYIKNPERFPNSFLLLTQFLSILSIFVLPRMHERYFYFCDIMSIIIFFWYGKLSLFLASILIIFSSMISYNFFFPFMPIYFTMPQASLMMLSGLILTAYALWCTENNPKKHYS